MIALETLGRKPSYIDSDGNVSVDLSAGVWKFNSQITLTNTAIVTRETEMRLDLVARILYGSDAKLDYLMKLNGISNPFSVYAGQVIVAGEISEMSNCIGLYNISDDNSEKTDIRSSLFDASKLTKKDQKRIEYIKKKSDGQSNLPPNFADLNTDEITIKDGKVIFGDNVVVSKTECEEPLSRAKIKARLLENRIFKLKI